MAESVLWEAGSQAFQPCNSQNIDAFIRERYDFDWIASIQHTPSDGKTKIISVIKFTPLDKKSGFALSLYTSSLIRVVNNAVIRTKEPQFYHGTPEDMFLKFILMANQYGFGHMIGIVPRKKNLLERIPFLFMQFRETCL